MHCNMHAQLHMCACICTYMAREIVVQLFTNMLEFKILMKSYKHMYIAMSPTRVL